MKKRRRIEVAVLNKTVISALCHKSLACRSTIDGYRVLDRATDRFSPRSPSDPRPLRR
jgi:hypothetical protein